MPSCELRPAPGSFRIGWAGAATAPIVAAALLVGGSAPRAGGAPEATEDHGHHAGMEMSEAEMRRWNDEWRAAHPDYRVTYSGAVADTFTASGFRFDTDGKTTTQVDTAHIFIGETIMWRRILGTHTVTSGTGSADPNVASLFDVPLDTTNPTFFHTYTSAGLFPFFCRTHEANNMTGWVEVKEPVGVTPTPGRGGTHGFTAAPAPNPTRAGVTVLFSVAERGRGRLEVFDVAGRRVARVLDRALGPGEYAVPWDGRGLDGAQAGPGVYFVRLRLPGYAESRRIVVER